MNKQKYLEYLVAERQRWEEYLRTRSISPDGYAKRAHEQILRITFQIEEILNIHTEGNDLPVMRSEDFSVLPSDAPIAAPNVKSNGRKV